MLYVLTTKMESNKWGPVAVVDDESVADEWANADPENDWVALNLNDLSTTSLAEKHVKPTVFQPKSPEEKQKHHQEVLNQIRQNLEKAHGQVKKLNERVKSSKRVRAAARRMATRDLPQRVVNHYLDTCLNEGKDPEIYDFLDHVKSEYRANMSEPEYEKLVDDAYALYKQQVK
jgi:hypothetical protein